MTFLSVVVHAPPLKAPPTGVLKTARPHVREAAGGLEGVTLCNMPTTKRQSWADARASFKRDQRQAIAMAAMELLVEGGSAGLTMSTLAERADISRQTLYRYFPDMASVLAASVEGIEAADAELGSWVLEVSDPREQLHRCVDALIDAGSQHAGSVEELMAALPPQAREALHAHERRTVQLIAKVLQSLRDQKPRGYDGDPDLDAPLILGLISAASEPARQRTHDLIDHLTT